MQASSKHLIHTYEDWEGPASCHQTVLLYSFRKLKLPPLSGYMGITLFSFVMLFAFSSSKLCHLRVIAEFDDSISLRDVMMSHSIQMLTICQICNARNADSWHFELLPPLIRIFTICCTRMQESYQCVSDDLTRACWAESFCSFTVIIWLFFKKTVCQTSVLRSGESLSSSQVTSESTELLTILWWFCWSL